ncbi:hypothetical protein CFD26_100056 [Aspergillus turcosus]|uniref:Uncharacterized protein n=1 Tax=Aspergillus turcosus TaxID=1245748 RepID=A0A3R7G3U3_9EURO|nr:hypothetical protein CFD26_100056 [Aspergillus turcosus]
MPPITNRGRTNPLWESYGRSRSPPSTLKRSKNTPIHRHRIIHRIDRPRLHEIKPLALDSVAVAPGSFRAERQVDL